MSLDQAAEWDERYQSSGYNLASPREFLAEVLPQLPRQGWGLDVAMGEGHNANLLAKHGLRVLGVDFSLVALRKANSRYPNMRTALVNLPQIHLQPGSFDVILNFWFLDRKLFPLYQQLLNPGGYLVLETMRFDPDRDQSHLRYEYLIQPGELLQSFSGWEFLVYDENVKATVKGQQQLAIRMLARKPIE
jgi:2-polyprenyl-3-methyl-5-hydroxy-6-metoxy-1,4-benzoquinol methylase